jgi:hypothetical protein
MLKRPEQHEYDPYFSIYINLIPDIDILQFLQQQRNRINDLFSRLSEEQGEQRYAPGKWKIKEVLSHISDSERIMSYWMLNISRGDTTKLQGYDQEVFVNLGSFSDCMFKELIADFQAVRQATLSLLTTISETAWLRAGTVVNKEVTARTLLYVIAGHAEHHLDAIKNAVPMISRNS